MIIFSFIFGENTGTERGQSWHKYSDIYFYFLVYLFRKLSTPILKNSNGFWFLAQNSATSGIRTKVETLS